MTAVMVRLLLVTMFNQGKKRIEQRPYVYIPVSIRVFITERESQGRERERERERDI